MISKARATSLGAAAVLVGGLLLAGTGTAGANSGYPVCVKAGTPVETGPGGSVVYTMSSTQAWHVYTQEANQWTQGYVSRTDPLIRGWVWGGHFDSTRTPYNTSDGGNACP
ncbi:MAG TPA: hypothetical protein VMB79_06040 [Jatrophihabitans sp.]|nr:hypothetical protein [Jatrophihabitans sp.]